LAHEDRGQALRQGGGPDPRLRALGVSRSFEGIHALEDVDLELAPDEVLGLIGPNGAGKTTLVNLLTGFDLPSAGRIVLGSTDITRWPPHRRGRAGLARTFQHGRLFRGLTVRENVEVAALGAGASPAKARERAARLLELLGLSARADDSAAVLPHGDERRLGVARALALQPRFVLMDEPAAGLHEAEIPAFAAVVRSVRDDFGAGVLLIDHNVALIMEVCDRVHVLDRGRTLAEGTPQEIRRNFDVATAYLGAGASSVEAVDV
jgi:branched-chain amino acid transport system ATP-binding protein